MKTRLIISVLAVLLIVTLNPCFALFDFETVSKERAKELGMEVRTKAAGPKHVQVELEFKTEGNFKAFSAEGKLKDFSQVDLKFGKGQELMVTAPLREDRSKPGRVAVNFTADRTQLDNLTLSVRVPGPTVSNQDGGTIYELRVKDFVQLEKVR